MTALELTGQIVFLILLLIFSLIMSRYDIKTLAVPDWPYWAGCICLIGAGLIFHRFEIYLFLISALILAAIYYLARKISKDHLGMGDVYFGFFQGLCIGLRVIWVCLAVETFTGLIAFLILYLVKKEKGIKMPFIPFMSAGLLTAFILEWLVL